MAAKKGKAKKTPAKKAAKNVVKAAPKGDGLGREGTPARFIREQYLAGKPTGEIFEKVKAKFPKNNINNTAYVSWYATKMRKDGLLKAST